MKTLFFVLLLLSTVHAQQAALKPVTGKKVALVIGNNGYTASPLKNCVSDATAIAKLLREQLGFDTVLADRDSENLDRLAFTRRLQAFQKEAQGAAVAVFYYAGHGMEDFDGRDNYLIPVDADLTEAAKDNAGLQAQGIPLEFVLKTMKEATQGAKIILLDCCRERPADRAIQTRDGGGFVMPTDSNMPQDTLIMLAAAPARTASDGEGHGPFTAALIKHLSAPGIALHQIFRSVRNEVLTFTNQQQKPWLKLDGAGDFFYDHALVVGHSGSSDLGISALLPTPGSNTTPVAYQGGKNELELIELPIPKAMSIEIPRLTGIRNLERTTEPHLNMFFAPRGTTNVARKKKVTSSDSTPIIGELALVTDGDADSAAGSFVELQPGMQWVQIDLEVKRTIQKIALWHYHQIAQAYHDVIVQASDDPEFKSGVITLWNSDHDNSSKMGIGTDPAYVESNYGRLIDGKGVEARYVRLWSNGNTASDMNHYCEVQVFAAPNEKRVFSANPLNEGTIGKQHEVTLPGAVKLSLCFCPAGSFTMGSPSSELGRGKDEQQHEVRIEKAFWIGQTEVTEVQWRTISFTSLQEQLDKATALDRVVEKNPPYRGGDNFPMTYVSAYDAKQFVKFLNVFIPQQGWEWALPSEEQWEYACRAGSKKAFWNSDKLSSAQANFENNTSSQGSRKAGYLGAPCKVASFAPNGWKIFDMHGNVSEWCSDYVWHQETVKGTSSFLGYAINSYRGGSWNDQASSCRSAFRSSRDRYVGRSSAIGFRVALVPSE